jgi:hypothetical protein
MRSAPWRWAGCALALLLAAGCGPRLHDERTIVVDAGVEKTLTLDPPTRDEKVHVQVNAAGTPVNVYCYLQKDQAAAEKAIHLHADSDKFLAKSVKSDTADLEFTIPAKETALIMLSSAARTAASAKVTIDAR